MAVCLVPVIGKNEQVHADPDMEKTITGLGLGTISDPVGTGLSNKTVWKGSKVYFGKYGNPANPVLYRVLTTSTSGDFTCTDDNGTTVNAMLLECDSVLKTKRFDQSSNVWSAGDGKKCELNEWLNGNDFLSNTSVFTPLESAAIAKSTKLEVASGDGKGWDNANSDRGLNYGPLRGEKVFLLDAVEATRESYGYYDSYGRAVSRKKTGTVSWWWLRSAYSDNDCSAGIVDPYGLVSYNIVDNSSNLGTCPAFNINLSSVIFSSLISGTSGGAGAEYKLTVKDNSIKTVIENDGITRIENTVTIPVSITGTYNRVSVVMTDGTWTENGWSDGASLKYYGKLGADDSFVLPNDYNLSWNTYILAEQVNGEKETDYASVPVKVTVPWVKTGDTLLLGTVGIENPASPNSEDDAWKGSYVYYGTYDKDYNENQVTPFPVRYRVLRNNITRFSTGTTEEEKARTMLLDCDSVLYNQQFDSDGNKNDTEKKLNDWHSSDIAGLIARSNPDANIKAGLNTEGSGYIETGFTNAEREAIAQSYIEGYSLSNSTVSLQDYVQSSYQNYIALNGEKLFLLDGEDVSNNNYGYHKEDGANHKKYYSNSSIAAGWWLRSDDDNEDIAGCVTDDGHLFDSYVIYSGVGVSPAFNINLSSVIFSSLIKKTPESTGAEYKLTIKDDDLNIAVTTGAAVTLVNSGSNVTVTVPYTITDASNTSKPNTVSIVVTDKDVTWSEENGWENVTESTKFQYVNKQVNPIEDGQKDAEYKTSGIESFQINLSEVTEKQSPVWGTDYHVYIFAEDVKVDDTATEGINESQLTDYASKPVEIEHAHEFTYAEVATTNGKKIVATCSNANDKCNLGNSTEHKVELVITAPGYNTYGSTGSKSATLTGLAAFNAATGKNVKAEDVKYVGIYGTAYASSTVPPTDAGKYKAFIAVSGKNAEVSYEISKAETAVSTAPLASTIAYGDSLAESNISGGVVTASISGENTTVAGKFAWDNATEKPVVADSGVTEYKAVFTPDVSTNYKGAEVNLKLTVNPKEIIVTGITAKDKVYNGNNTAELDLTDVKLEGVLDIDKDKLRVIAKGEFESADAGRGKKVTIYDLQLTGDAAANYKIAAAGQQTEATAEIFKIDARIKEAPVAKTGLVYTGDNLELIIQGTAENGTLVYAVTEKGAVAPADDKYSSDIPKAVNAGEYKVYYKVIGDTNYNDVAVATIDVAIKRASQEAPKLTSTDETVSGKNDGTISGLTTAMEISTEGADKGFSTVTDISGTGFVPGTYFVRYTEDKNHDASVSVTITIKAGANAPKPDLKPQPDPVIPTPIVTSVPEEPDTGSTTVMNNDGSTTTTTKTKNEDGTIIESTIREWKNGDKNITEVIKDADGKVISTMNETVRISKKGTKTEKTDIQKADGYHRNSSVKTYKSGKEITSSSTSFANGSKQAYTETKNADGTLTRKVMDTNTKGKSTLTVTTKNLVKTVTKYKVTGDGKIRLTSLKTDGDTAIIPKTVTFDGEKNMIVSLGKGLFKGMEGIKEIYIYAENLKKIYAGAFDGIPADAKFYIKATAINCKKIVRMIKKSGFGKVDYTKI